MTPEEKKNIAYEIKPISLEEVDLEMTKLETIGHSAETMSNRSRLGNNIVDYFTFVQRLETKGKYNVSFYEFVERINEFKEKKFIQNMLSYYSTVKNKNGTKPYYKVLKEVYNICISAINIMRPLNCMEIYSKYGAKRVLNFCAGWGGSTIAAAALKLEAFYGVEINVDLKPAYDQMIDYLKNRSAATTYQIDFCDAVEYDYSGLNYDCVFCSPPYYSLEKYPHNLEYKSKSEMNETFYKPLFHKTFQGLSPNGHYIINVCREVYTTVMVPMLGEAMEVFALKKSKRQNDHVEMVYVWKKLQS